VAIYTNQQKEMKNPEGNPPLNDMRRKIIDIERRKIQNLQNK
jgi:hypothetical protein